VAAASAAYQPLFFGAVHRAGVAVCTLLAVGAVPVFAGLVGWVALAHRPTRAWLTAILVAVAGLALRSLGQTGPGDGPGLGIVMALTAPFGTSRYVVAAKAELDRHAAELPAAAYLLGSVMLAPLVLSQPLAWVAVALDLGMVTMALGNVLAVAGMRSMPPSRPRLHPAARRPPHRDPARGARPRRSPPTRRPRRTPARRRRASAPDAGPEHSDQGPAPTRTRSLRACQPPVLRGLAPAWRVSKMP
jgi:hypothetical protein